MRAILIFLVGLLILGTASAYLGPQANPDVLYSANSGTGFLKDKPHNTVWSLPPFDMTGFGYMAGEIYNQSWMRKDGNIGKKYAHFIDGADYQWYPDLAT